MVIGFKKFLFLSALLVVQINACFAQDWKYIQAMPKDDLLYQLVEDSDSAFVCSIIKNADTGIILQKVDRKANTAWRKKYKFGKHQLAVFRMIKSDQLFLAGSIALYDSALQNYTALDGFLMVLNACFEPIHFYQFTAPGNNQILDMMELDGKILLVAQGIIPGIIPNSTSFFWFDPQTGAIEGPTLSAVYLPASITYLPNDQTFYATGSYYQGFAPDTANKLIRGYILKMDKQLQPIWQAINDTLNPKAYESGQDIIHLKEQSPVYLYSDRDYYTDNPAFGPPGICYVNEDGERLKQTLIINTGVKETAQKIMAHSSGNLFCLTDYWPNPDFNRGYGALYKIRPDLSFIEQKFLNEGPVDQQNELKSRNLVLHETSDGHILVAGSVYNSVSGSLDAYIHLLDSNLEYIPISSLHQSQLDADCPIPVRDSVYHLNPSLITLDPDSFQIAFIPSKEFKVLGIMAQAENENGLSLYPNPCQDQFWIKGNHPDLGFVKVDIYDLSGKLIQTIDHHESGLPIQLGNKAQQHQTLLVRIQSGEWNRSVILQRIH